MNESPSPVRKRRLWLRILIASGVIAILMAAIFGAMLWSWTDFERVDAASAEQSFVQALERAGGGPAYFDTSAPGEVVIRHELEKEAPPRVRGLHLMLWQAERERLVRLDVPGWFVRTKLRSSVGIEAFVSRHGFDVHRSREIRAEDLARLGHGLLLDQRFEDESRLLIWLEGEERP